MFQLFQRPTCPLLRDSSDVAYISQLQAANEGSNERFFFRGQSNKNWDVRPCLFRENNLTIESDIISEACARAPFEFGGRSAFERLTKLQHYGLSTRMLDVTLNPLVALYFACAKCEDKENLVYMGETSRKTPVWLNRYAIEADKIILTGGVVYHFLAGYGGGRKSLVPGIAGKETINTNHCNALNPGFGEGINENVYSGNLSKSNPFHDDLEEAAAMAKPAYLLNVVANSDQQIIAAFAGDWIKAHKAATELVDSIDGVYVDERADLVIASAGGFPKDINLYQTSKTLSNSKIMIADGGTMIILSECSEGFGNQDCEDQIVKFTNMEEREKALRADFSIGGFVGYDFSDTAERYNMILVTEIPAEKFKNTKIHVVKTLDEAIRVAKELNDGSIDDMKVALLPHGANTLPKYR